MTKLANGTPVVFKHNDEYLNCLITGIAHNLPGENYLYILSVYDYISGIQPIHDEWPVQVVSKEYPYQSFLAHESQFKY